tara:strand:+ start:991 stop:1416 length:426 start_codon:yes stop_codon:yes gene_type:complete
MKNSIVYIFLLGLVIACTPSSPPEEPTPKRDMLVGKWSSSAQVTRTTLNGVTLEWDSIVTGINFEFTASYWAYLDYQGFMDTSRYNCDGDTLYFIKNALAVDTLIIEEISESNLFIAVRTSTDDVNGKIVKQQSLLRFFKN